MPRTAFPLVVKVLEVLLSVTLPVKDARPLASMARRSTGWLVVALVLPAALVLRIRLPPKLPVASCTTQPDAGVRWQHYVKLGMCHSAPNCTCASGVAANGWKAYRKLRPYLGSGSLHRAIIGTEENAAQCKAADHSTASILPLESQDCTVCRRADVAV